MSPSTRPAAGPTLPTPPMATRSTAAPRMPLVRLPALSGDLRSVLPYLNLLAILAILWLDWLTPAGIVVGIFLCLPILLTSAMDDPRHVGVASAVAVVGFFVAAWLGRDPISPALVWVPNRVFAFLTLPASTGIALLLQRRRREAERARDLNRLLMSLLAHDLRSPLVLAEQGLDYVVRTVAGGAQPDVQVLEDTRARLGRSLRTIESVLMVARAEVASADRPVGSARAAVRLGEEIEAEVEAFADEARWRGKTLVTDLRHLGRRTCAVDALVLRQALAILLDNAIRYAAPGPVRVRAEVEGAELTVTVADCGTGGAARGAERPAGGSGLGLELCRMLAARAGGALEAARFGPEETVFVLRLPASPEPGA